MKFQNPLFAGDYPDPSIVRVGDDYYVTHSSFNYAPGLLVWHSRDLVRWRPVTHALPEYDGDVWAPEIVHHGGRFHIYYKTTGGNHVVSADHIDGPWSPPGDLKCGWIDPGHCTSSDGTRYIHLSDGRAFPLSADGLTRVGEPQHVYQGWPIPEEWRIEGFCLEGPKLFWKDGWLYLVSAQGGTAGPPTSHMAVVARGRHPLGPFENSPHNPLIHTKSRHERWWSRGHATLFEGPDRRWWAITHGYEQGFHTLGRQTLLEPIEWGSDGWPVQPRGYTAEQPLDLPGPAHLDLPLSDDFVGPHLGMPWRFWAEHDRSRYRFLAGGGIELNGKGDKIESSGPLTIIARDHAYSVGVEAERFGDATVGLMLWYSDKAYVGIGWNDKGLHRLRSGEPVWSHQPVASRRLGLRLVNDNHELDFLYRDGAGPWRKLDGSLEVSGLHHNTFGGFLSLRPALFAAGGGAGRFHAFRYTALPGARYNDEPRAAATIGA